MASVPQFPQPPGASPTSEAVTKALVLQECEEEQPAPLCHAQQKDLREEPVLNLNDQLPSLLGHAHPKDCTEVDHVVEDPSLHARRLAKALPLERGCSGGDAAAAILHTEEVEPYVQDDDVVLRLAEKRGGQHEEAAASSSSEGMQAAMPSAEDKEAERLLFEIAELKAHLSTRSLAEQDHQETIVEQLLRSGRNNQTEQDDETNDRCGQSLDEMLAEAECLRDHVVKYRHHIRGGLGFAPKGTKHRSELAEMEECLTKLRKIAAVEQPRPTHSVCSF